MLVRIRHHPLGVNDLQDPVQIGFKEAYCPQFLNVYVTSLILQHNRQSAKPTFKGHPHHENDVQLRDLRLSESLTERLGHVMTEMKTGCG